MCGASIPRTCAELREKKLFKHLRKAPTEKQTKLAEDKIFTVSVRRELIRS